MLSCVSLLKMWLISTSRSKRNRKTHRKSTTRGGFCRAYVKHFIYKSRVLLHSVYKQSIKQARFYCEEMCHCFCQESDAESGQDAAHNNPITGASGDIVHSVPHRLV